MKRLCVLVCILLTISTSSLPLLGSEVDSGRAEFVRTGMTIAGAAIGLVTGASIGLSFSQNAIETPLSDTLLLTIPVAAAGAAAGALAGGWIANTALRHQASPLLAILDGAWLGLVGGAFVGSVTFSLNFAIAQPLLEVPEGYWGDPPIPPVAMAFVAGGLWGGIFGALAGAAVIPAISLLMDF